MNAAFEPAPFDLARLYDREGPAFRITPKAVFAVCVVGALHLGIGLAMARAFFALPLDDAPSDAIALTPLRPPPPPKPVRPPPRTEPPPPHDPAPQVDRHELLTDAPAGAALSSISSVPTAPDPPAPPPPPAHIDPPPPAPPSVITNPNWLSRPTAEQVGKLYPTRALDQGRGGKATLLCEVSTTGAVSNCSLVEETPLGYGFGAAAQAMTRYFRLSPGAVDGVSASGSRVRIPIVFNPG